MTGHPVRLSPVAYAALRKATSLIAQEGWNRFAVVRTDTPTMTAVLEQAVVQFAASCTERPMHMKRTK